MKNIIALIALSLSITCYAQEKIEARAERLALYKSKLESILNKKPYKEEEHSIIKSYFHEFESFVEDLSTSSKYLKKFNQYLKTNGPENFCQNTYLNKDHWNELMKNCTKNNFFLCAESVRTYPGSKVALYKLVNIENKAEMKEITACE